MKGHRKRPSGEHRRPVPQTTTEVMEPNGPLPLFSKPPPFPVPFGHAVQNTLQHGPPLSHWLEDRAHACLPPPLKWALLGSWNRLRVRRSPLLRFLGVLGVCGVKARTRLCPGFGHGGLNRSSQPDCLSQLHRLDTLQMSDTNVPGPATNSSLPQATFRFF